MAQTFGGITATPAAEMPEDRLRVLIHGAQGSGKEVAYGEPVLTPDGWVEIEKLTVGQQVIGSNGQPTEVYGVYDQGVKPVWRLTMNDGASVLTGADHQWQVTNGKGFTYVTTTAALIDGWTTRYADRRPAIPRMAAAQHPEADLPIPPYVLGALLADGCLHGDQITWTKNLDKTVEEFRRHAPPELYDFVDTPRTETKTRYQRFRGSLLRAQLTDLDLRRRSAEKFIPEQYLIASEQQRRDLLAGLFDGDGRLSGKGQPLYHSTSLRLAKDVQRLIWSLGYGANIQNKKTDGTWCVGLVSTGLNPFRASEHVSAVNEREAYYHEARRIVGIEPEGQAECRCIAVTADDHLYVTRDYIVTHNTWLSSSIAEIGPTLFVDLVGEKGAKSFQGSAWAQNITVVRPTSITALDDIYWALAAGGHGYRAVVLDSLSAAQKTAMRFLLGHEETAVREIRRGGVTADMRTWGQILDIMTDLCTFWFGLADGERSDPMHVVMTSQSKMHDDDEGNPRAYPDVSKGSRAIALATPSYVLFTDQEEVVGDDGETGSRHIVRLGYDPRAYTKGRIPAHLHGKIPSILGRGKTSLTMKRFATSLGIPTE